LVNLTWWKANYEFTLLLDEVSRSMEPAWKIREEILSGIAGQQEEQDVSGALERLREAPIERLFTTYASRVRSRGELGVLSSLNQRIWREYGLLNDFLQQLR